MYEENINQQVDQNLLLALALQQSIKGGADKKENSIKQFIQSFSAKNSKNSNKISKQALLRYSSLIFKSCQQKLKKEDFSLMFDIFLYFLKNIKSIFENNENWVAGYSVIKNQINLIRSYLKEAQEYEFNNEQCEIWNQIIKILNIGLLQLPIQDIIRFEKLNAKIKDSQYLESISITREEEDKSLQYMGDPYVKNLLQQFSSNMIFFEEIGLNILNDCFLVDLTNIMSESEQVVFKLINFKTKELLIQDYIQMHINFVGMNEKISSKYLIEFLEKIIPQLINSHNQRNIELILFIFTNQQIKSIVPNLFNIYILAIKSILSLNTRNNQQIEETSFIELFKNIINEFKIYLTSNFIQFENQNYEELPEIILSVYYFFKQENFLYKQQVQENDHASNSDGGRVADNQLSCKSDENSNLNPDIFEMSSLMMEGELNANQIQQKSKDSSVNLKFFGEEPFNKTRDKFILQDQSFEVASNFLIKQEHKSLKMELSVIQYPRIVQNEIKNNQQFNQSISTIFEKLFQGIKNISQKQQFLQNISKRINFNLIKKYIEIIEELSDYSEDTINIQTYIAKILYLFLVFPQKANQLEFCSSFQEYISMILAQEIIIRSKISYSIISKLLIEDSQQIKQYQDIIQEISQKIFLNVETLGQELKNFQVFFFLIMLRECPQQFKENIFQQYLQETLQEQRIPLFSNSKLIANLLIILFFLNYEEFDQKLTSLIINIISLNSDISLEGQFNPINFTLKQQRKKKHNQVITFIAENLKQIFINHTIILNNNLEICQQKILAYLPQFFNIVIQINNIALQIDRKMEKSHIITLIEKISQMSQSNSIEVALSYFKYLKITKEFPENDQLDQIFIQQYCIIIKIINFYQTKTLLIFKKNENEMLIENNQNNISDEIILNQIVGNIEYYHSKIPLLQASIEKQLYKNSSKNFMDFMIYLGKFLDLQFQIKQKQFENLPNDFNQIGEIMTNMNSRIASVSDKEHIENLKKNNTEVFLIDMLAIYYSPIRLIYPQNTFDISMIEQINQLIFYKLLLKKNIDFLDILCENNKDIFENLSQPVKIKLFYIYFEYSNLIFNEGSNMENQLKKFKTVLFDNSETEKSEVYSLLNNINRFICFEKLYSYLINNVKMENNELFFVHLVMGKLIFKLNSQLSSQKIINFSLISVILFNKIVSDQIFFTTKQTILLPQILPNFELKYQQKGNQLIFDLLFKNSFVSQVRVEDIFNSKKSLNKILEKKTFIIIYEMIENIFHQKWLMEEVSEVVTKKHPKLSRQSKRRKSLKEIQELLLQEIESPLTQHRELLKQLELNFIEILLQTDNDIIQKMLIEKILQPAISYTQYEEYKYQKISSPMHSQRSASLNSPPAEKQTEINFQEILKIPFDRTIKFINNFFIHNDQIHIRQKFYEIFTNIIIFLCEMIQNFDENQIQSFILEIRCKQIIELLMIQYQSSKVYQIDVITFQTLISNVFKLIQKLTEMKKIVNKKSKNILQTLKMEFLLISAFLIRQQDSEKNISNQKQLMPIIEEQDEKNVFNLGSNLQNKDLKNFDNQVPEEVGCQCYVNKLKKVVDQHFYKCHSCQLATDTSYICTACAWHCHNGHDLIYSHKGKGNCNCAEKMERGVPLCKLRKSAKKEINLTHNSIFSSKSGNSFEHIIKNFVPNQFMDSYKDDPWMRDNFLVSHHEKSDSGSDDIDEEEKNDLKEGSSGSDREIEIPHYIFERQFRGSNFPQSLKRTYLEKEKNPLDRKFKTDMLYGYQRFRDQLQNKPLQNISFQQPESVISDEQDSMQIDNPYNENQDVIDEKSLEDSCSMIVETPMYAIEGQQSNKNKLCLNRQSEVFKKLITENKDFKLIEQLIENVTEKVNLVLDIQEHKNANKIETEEQMEIEIKIDITPILMSNFEQKYEKIIHFCFKIFKIGFIDMKIQKIGEDSLLPYQGNPTAPMIIRRPISYNQDNLIAISSGVKVIFVEKNKLILKSLNKDENLADFAMHESSSLGFSITNVLFSPKNPFVCIVSGLIQLSVIYLAQDGKVTKIHNPNHKFYGEYINKIYWVPHSDSFLAIMTSRSINIVNIAVEGKVSSILKFNANEESGIIRDFCISETQNDEFLLLVACADGYVYYQYFNLTQKDVLILIDRINIPVDLIGKSSVVAQAINYSHLTQGLFISYKNGTNIVGILDLTTHTLSNCIKLKPSQQNKQHIFNKNIFEKSGEIMVNVEEAFANSDQFTLIANLKSEKSQNDYSMQQGQLCAIQVQKNKIYYQPLLTISTNAYQKEERKTEGYCVIKSINDVFYVVSLLDDGSVNVFAYYQEEDSLQPQIDHFKIVKQVPQKLSFGRFSDKDAKEHTLETKLKQSLKFEDLPSQTQLFIDFKENSHPMRPEELVVDIHGQSNEKIQKIVFGSGQVIDNKPSMEISIKNVNKRQLITGVRLTMEMASNLGLNIYKIKYFNRELKLLNSRNDNKRFVDIPLSQVEIIFIHLQGSMQLIIQTTNPKDHPIRLNQIEVYGQNVDTYQIDKKISHLTKFLNLKMEEVVEYDEQTKKELEQYFYDSKDIKSVDFNKRNQFLKDNVQEKQVIDLINSLDILSFILILSNQQQQDILYQQNINYEILEQFCFSLRAFIMYEGEPLIYFSVKRCLKWGLQTLKAISEEVIILGHPLDYQTFKDMARCKNFDENLNSNKIESFRELEINLKKIEKILNKRLPQLFYIFTLYPNLVISICKTFFAIVNQKGKASDLQALEEAKVEPILRIIIRLVIMEYHYINNNILYIQIPQQELNSFKMKDIKNQNKFQQEAFVSIDYIFQNINNPKQELMQLLKKIVTIMLENIKNEFLLYSYELQQNVPRFYDYSYKIYADLNNSDNLDLPSSIQDQIIVEEKFEPKIQELPIIQQVFEQMEMGYQEKLDDEEMMKLAIEMSLNDQQLEKNSQQFQAPIEKMDEESHKDEESKQISLVSNKSKKVEQKPRPKQQQVQIFIFDMTKDLLRKIVEILVNGKNLMNEYIIVNVYLLLRIVKTQSQVSIKLQAAYDEEITEIIFNSLIQLLDKFSQDQQNSDKKVLMIYLYIIQEILRVKSDKKSSFKEFTQSLSKYLKQFEESRKIYLTDYIFEILEKQYQRFITGKSQIMKIEQQDPKNQINLLKIGEVIAIAFKKPEEFSTKFAKITQYCDQVIFNFLIKLVSSLLEFKIHIFSDKYTLFLCKVLLDSQTKNIVKYSAKKLIQDIMGSENKFNQLKDQTAYKIMFELIQQLEQQTNHFSDINYDNLLLLVKYLEKINKNAEQRPQNWIIFYLLNEIVINQIKECVVTSLKLICLYYQELTPIFLFPNVESIKQDLQIFQQYDQSTLNSIYKNIVNSIIQTKIKNKDLSEKITENLLELNEFNQSIEGIIKYLDEQTQLVTKAKEIELSITKEQQMEKDQLI